MLYFFGNGHHTNKADFKMLSKFRTLVNVIPVITKADSFKPDELYKMKVDIISTAVDHGVKFFDCAEAIKSLTEEVSSE